MKKILIAFFGVLFAASVASAQQVFLSLTKQDENINNLPVNVTVIDQKQIQSSRAQTVGELLQNEVGINFITNGTIGATESLSIRGASSLQTLVLIDGRRVNDIGMGSADLTAIPVSAIDRIEIIRGAGAAIYGTSAFGGVVNVITKRAVPDSRLEAGASYGSFKTFDSYITGIAANEKAGVLLSYDKRMSDGSRENSKYNGDSVFFNGLVKTWKDSTLSLTGNVYDSHYGVPGSTSWLTPDNYQDDFNRYIKADYDIKGDNISLNVNGYVSDNQRNYYDATGNPYDPTFTLTDAKYKYDSFVAGAQANMHYKNIFLLGAELSNEIYKENEELSGYNADHSRRNYAAYGQLNLPLGKLSLIGSARYDDSSQYGGVFTPAISAIFTINDSFKISGNVGKVWRAPVFTELYWNQAAYGMFGDPNLKPERGDSFDFGAEYSKNKIKLSASAFYIKSSDLISWVYNPATFETRVENIDSARQYGAEVSAGLILTSWLSNTVGYTYLKAEDANTDKVLPYKPENTISYTVTVKPVEKLSLAATLYFSDKVYTDAGNTQTLDNFVTLDLNAGYQLTKNVELWVKGMNVGNSKYELSSGYPMPVAAVYGGANVKVF